MRDRLRTALPAVVGLLLFGVALEVLRTELHALTWHGLVTAVSVTPPTRMALALFLTAANYTVLTGYDLLAFAYVGRRAPLASVATASFLAYAISNNVGFAVLSGSSIRHRFYSRLGITTQELSRIVFAYVTAFWLGLLLVGGLSLALGPVPQALGIPAPHLVRPVGWLLVLIVAAYLGLAAARVGPFQLRGLTLPLPPLRLALAQLGVSALDWALAATVIFVLLPSPRPPLSVTVGAFLAAQVLGLASHVPGGVGVFEGLMVLLLKPFLDASVLLPTLIVYRALYYLLPLAVATTVLVVDEVRQRRAVAARVGVVLGQLTEDLTPLVLSLATFVAGLVLLASGATPAEHGRLAVLDRLFPLGIIEVSHFTGSVIGAMLLVLAQGLARRLDAAFVLTVTAMALGVLVSLLKGVDYEEAVILAVMLLALWRARPAFTRRAALFDTRFTTNWIVAILGAVGATAWLAAFAFKHVEYSSVLWWQFELHGDASRTLRATVGAGVALLVVGSARLLTRAAHEAPAVTDADLATADTIIRAQSATSPQLVFLRDKSVLFDDTRTAFVMYGVQGRTWVALGDPVGPAERASALIRMFLERAADFGGTPAFYEISSHHLHRYVDLGLSFVKLGEEARVDLRSFTTAGGRGKPFRTALNRLAREGATFRLVPPPEVPAIIEALRVVSDDWLAHRAAAEKGFSLGFFDPGYLARSPIGIIEHAGRIVAFANLWLGADRRDMSVDLMRYHREAPK